MCLACGDLLTDIRHVSNTHCVYLNQTFFFCTSFSCAGLTEAERLVNSLLAHHAAAVTGTDVVALDTCRLLNVSICAASVAATRFCTPLRVVVYNPLPHAHTSAPLVLPAATGPCNWTLHGMCTHAHCSHTPVWGIVQWGWGFFILCIFVVYCFVLFIFHSFFSLFSHEISS